MQKIDSDKQMCLHCTPFQWPCGGFWSDTCSITQCSMSRATPEATGCCHQATTQSVLPRWPPGRQQTKHWCKCVHFAGRFDDRGDVPVLYCCIAQWRRFTAFLKTTTRRHRASTHSDSINRTCLPLILREYLIRAPHGARAYPLILSKYSPCVRLCVRASVRPPTDKGRVCILCVKQHFFVIF